MKTKHIHHNKMSSKVHNKKRTKYRPAVKHGVLTVTRITASLFSAQDTVSAAAPYPRTTDGYIPIGTVASLAGLISICNLLDSLAAGATPTTSTVGGSYSVDGYTGTQPFQASSIVEAKTQSIGTVRTVVDHVTLQPQPGWPNAGTIYFRSTEVTTYDITYPNT